MPKPHTFPTLFDECKTLSISKLKEWGYLQANIIKTGTITWSRNGEQYASIGIYVSTLSPDPYIELQYTCNQKPVKYKVKFFRQRSNIGKGFLWYFLCPSTGKRCRKLYMVDTYFLHRSAFAGAMYEKQTYSKHARMEFKKWGRLFEVEQVYEKLYSRYFKSSYAGAPTKKYVRMCKRLAACGENPPV